MHDRLIRALREAIVTMAAAVATLACALAIDAERGPAIMAVVLSIALSRSHLDLDLRGRLEAAFALPLVSLLAFAVGALLHRAPWLGALAFVVGMSLPIWLRRFGPGARRLGSLIALPFVVILTTPYVPTTRLGPTMAVLVPVIVAELALFWVSIFHVLARRWHWIAPARARAIPPAQVTRASTLRPSASTRMAIQMGCALAIAFAVGFGFFPERWGWLVLTAYIVGSGNQGRLDVVYKSALRVLGAAAGTVFALLFSFHSGANEATVVVMILAAVFFGVWLRPLGYAWWALFVTLALALLQGFDVAAPHGMLWSRLEEIVIGAAIAIAVASSVLPVRATDTMRRRIADALAILADALDPQTPPRHADEFSAAVERIEQVAPAFRASRLLTRRVRCVQPADWVDSLAASRTPAVALIASGETSGSVRRAVSDARKSLREPTAIGPAMDNLRRVLAEARS